MSNLKAILIDDEVSSTDILEYELQSINSSIDVIEKCNDARKAASLINTLKPDIVFLDIEMPWLSGFEILDQLTFKNFNLIFITAYNQYAIKAFKYLAVDYLLKPVAKEELKKTINRIQLRDTTKQREQLKNMVDLIKNSGLKSGKIPFPTQHGIEFFSANQIIHCEADSNYTKIYTTDNNKILISKTLKSIEEMINHHRFLRVHQSHLINLEYLKSYIKEDGGYIKMSNNTIIPLSRSRKAEFFDKIKEI